MADALTNITTNNHAIPLLSGYELTAKERAELDYVDDAEMADAHDRFFRYRGGIYDTQQFTRIDVHPNHSPFGTSVPRSDPMARWDGIQTDSFFSGVVIRHIHGKEAQRRGLEDFGYVVAGLAMS